jgi:putative ABC transport system substrate-binding protein
MTRRDLIAGLGASAWPVVARAQEAVTPVIGVLSGGRACFYESPPFLQGLRQVGYIEGRKVAIEYQWADGQYERLCRNLDPTGPIG